MERSTSCKHAPSCRSAPVRLAWLTRLRKGLRRGEERTRTERRSWLDPSTAIVCLRGEKKETKAVNLRWMFVLTGSGVVGTVLMRSLVIGWTPGLNRKLAVRRNGRPNGVQPSVARGSICLCDEWFFPPALDPPVVFTAPGSAHNFSPHDVSRLLTLHTWPKFLCAVCVSVCPFVCVFMLCRFMWEGAAV